MKKFAILFLGVALLTSGSGCCWWGWPFGYGGGGGGYGSGYGTGYGNPGCPGGNCGVPGSPVPLGTPTGGIYQQNTSQLPVLPGGFSPAPITAGLFGTRQAAVPQMGYPQQMGFPQQQMGYPQQLGYPQPGLSQTAFNTSVVESLPTY